LQNSALAATGAGLVSLPTLEAVASQWKKTSANDKLQIGLIGANGMGWSDLRSHLLMSDVQPKLDGLTRLGAASFPAVLTGSVHSQADNKTFLRFPLQQGEQLFGLGLNFKAVQQRGTIKTLRVDHYGGNDNGRTHAPFRFTYRA